MHHKDLFPLWRSVTQGADLNELVEGLEGSQVMGV